MSEGTTRRALNRAEIVVDASTGRVVLPVGVSLDEASRAFWDAVAGLVRRDWEQSDLPVMRARIRNLDITVADLDSYGRTLKRELDALKVEHDAVLELLGRAEEAGDGATQELIYDIRKIMGAKT